MRRSAQSPHNARSAKGTRWRGGARAAVHDATLRCGERMPGVGFDIKRMVSMAEARGHTADGVKGLGEQRGRVGEEDFWKTWERARNG